MESELSRLASFFSFPFNSPVSPTDLVKAGFYYEGNRDEVICYKCSFKHHGWQKGDVPFFIHSTKSRNCPLVRGDIPETSVTGKGQADLSNQLESVSITSTSGATGGPEDSQSQNVPMNRQQDTVKTTRPETSHITTNKTPDSQLPTENNDQSIVEGESPNGGTNYSITEPYGSIPEDRSSVRNEHSQQTCTLTQPPRKNDIIDEDDESTPTIPNDDWSSEREEPPTMEPLGVTETRPKYPQFAILANRLTTYRAWPSNLNQRPDQLAKCGLFYEGNHDYVRCFHCAGGLREWEPQDDPWVEHARWFPFCTFMRQLKGDRFIMDVQSGKITSQLQSASAGTNTPPEEDVSADNMDHPAVLSVMGMGYTKEMMRKAMSSLRKQKDKTLTAQNLLQVVWDIEECGETLDDEEDEEDEECHNDNANTTTQTTVPHNSTTDNAKSERFQEPPSTKDLEHLANENRELREQKTCKVCLDEEASIVFLPCGHLVTCPMCSSALRKCPVCRTEIRGTVKAIIS